MDAEKGTNGSGVGRDSSGVREQDRFLPIANISRIMKRGLPANAKIAKEAKETVQECVSEFISFITSEASDKCQREKRKTINGDDLLWALTTLGFEEYVEPLKLFLEKYRQAEAASSMRNAESRREIKQEPKQVLMESSGMVMPPFGKPDCEMDVSVPDMYPTATMAFTDYLMDRSHPYRK